VIPLPDLSIALEEYRMRIGLLAERCRELKMRRLFITEPTLWQEWPSREVASLFWLGYFGRYDHPKGYVAAPAIWLARLICIGALLQVAANRISSASTCRPITPRASPSSRTMSISTKPVRG
jgi:hypothetical protein